MLSGRSAHSSPNTDMLDTLKARWLHGTIHRLAGTGEAGYQGDGGPASVAQLNGPGGLAIGPDNSVYIAEIKSNVIRKVDLQTKRITTVAGCGRRGFSGDGGPAVGAELNGPEGVCVDRFGHIYIADSGNQRIRKVDAATGTITTLAGTGEAGRNVAQGPARTAKLNHPSGVAVDSQGNVYFNDYGNDLIQRIDTQGNLTVYAGTGRPGYSGDGTSARDACISDVYGVAMSETDDLYFIDSLNFAVRKVEQSTGLISTVIGKGRPGPAAEFASLQTAMLGGEAHAKGTIGSKVAHGLDIDSQGNVYVAETGVHRIRMLHKPSGLFFTLAGTGQSGLPVDGTPALSANLDVHGVRVDAEGHLYYLDFLHHVVNVIEF